MIDEYHLGFFAVKQYGNGTLAKLIIYAQKQTSNGSFASALYQICTDWVQDVPNKNN